MKVEFNPTAKTVAKAELIKKLHESGLSYRDIAKRLGHHFTYIFALKKWLVEKEKNEK